MAESLQDQIQGASDDQQWQEQGSQLPAYPQDGRLLELNMDTTGFRTYIDPQSLTAGADKVVRFTSVLVSASGVWNVTYEGLHCGEKSYRRFAYGSAGQWHELILSLLRAVSDHLRMVSRL